MISMIETTQNAENRARLADTAGSKAELTKRDEQTCCGDIQLSTGCIVIGSVLLLLNLAAVVRQAVAMTSPDFYPPPSENRVLNVMVISGCAVAMVFNCLLIIGVKRQNRCAVLLWLIYHGISYAAASIASAYVFVLACMAGGSIVSFLVLLVGLWTMAVFWYWFHIVRLYHQRLTIAI